MKTFVSVIVLILIASFGTGCTAYSSGADYDRTRLSEIVNGETTEAELIDILGSEPNSRNSIGNGNEMLSWQNISLDRSTRQYILGGSTTRTNSFMATVDSNRIVVDHRDGSTNTRSKSFWEANFE